MQYIEFLCYYILWSKGYCTIYNSQDVWNALPLKSQKGPRFSGKAIAYAHLFVQNVEKSLQQINLNTPDTPGDPLQLKYKGSQSLVLNAFYWRPTIKAELHQEAIRYWEAKLQERQDLSKSLKPIRCKFAGAGSFFLAEGSIGNVMYNDYDQQVTYDLLKEMGLFQERDSKTLWLKPHPFVKSNLMLHILQGKNSPNARKEIVIKNTNDTLDIIENNWKISRKLSN